MKRVNLGKAAGLDWIPGIFGVCAGQLAGVILTTLRPPPLCHCQSTPLLRPWMTSAQLHLPQHCKLLWKTASITFKILSACYPGLLAVCLQRQLDAIFAALHSALTHPDCPKSYIKMLFVDISSALKTQQWLYFRKAHLCTRILVNFYRCIQSIFNSNSK